ncbi:hypothetical protein JHK85_010207 [Glycine max]|nr:hypothetical protein JHK85_010207 [Glycine max]
MDLGYQNMIFKTGRKMVVDNIASTYSGVSDFHVILAKCRPLISNLSNSWPDVCLYSTKRKVMSSPTIDDNDNSPLVFPKKSKQEWKNCNPNVIKNGENSMASGIPIRWINIIDSTVLPSS